MKFKIYKEMNVRIEFNSSIIKRMRSLNLPVDHIGSVLFILFAIYEGRFDLLDEFDDFNREKRAILLYRQLERKGLLEQADEVNPVNYILTKEGYTLIDFLKSELEESVFPSAAQVLEPIALEEKIDAPIEVWIRDFIRIFPEGEYFGRRLRTNKRDVIDRMTWFIETYGFNKDIILAATQKYVDSQQTYQFTLSSTTFIWKTQDGSKERVSALASWCEGIEEDKEKPNEQIYSESI